MEGWQRWANVGIQEQLCEKMEALKAAEDPEEIARRIRELQQQWRQAADVPRAQGEALWRRFKAAHDEVWTRCEAHFAAEAERRRDNLTPGKSRCASAPKRSPSRRAGCRRRRRSSACRPTGKRSGRSHAARKNRSGNASAVACDRFFTRRHEDLAQRKVMWADNLAKKDALCARAEALAESTDWDAAAAELRRLQGEWRAIGPVKKSRSEAIWQRFRGACDRFFLRFAQRHEIARGGARGRARGDLCGARRFRRLTPTSRPRCQRIRDASVPISAAPIRAARTCSRPSVRFARAGSRSSAPRRRSRPRRRQLDRRFCRRLRARVRPLAAGLQPAPISIPMPTGSGWRRWCCASKPSPRHSAGPPSADADKALTPATRLGDDAQGSAGGEHDRRQCRRREPLAGSAGRRAPGAGKLVAHWCGAGAGPPRL